VRAGREFRPDAVVLEVMLRDFGGLEVLRRLSAGPPTVCVLVLTAQESVRTGSPASPHRAWQSGKRRAG
jgi:two-component system OmpR family response regulator